MALHPMAEDYLDSNIDALNLNHANKVAREVHSKGLGGLGPSVASAPITLWPTCHTSDTHYI